MSHLAMIPTLNQFFNRNFTSWSFWDEHRSDAESVKILYNYLLNFQNMQTELTVVQAFWNLELIPIRKISSQASVFLPCPSLPCVSVAQISSTLEGGYVSAIAKYSGTFSYPSLGISNPNREKPTCYRIAWHLEAHEWFMEATDWNQAV